jgi:hypothetical protein
MMYIMLRSYISIFDTVLLLRRAQIHANSSHTYDTHCMREFAVRAAVCLARALLVLVLLLLYAYA